MEVSELEKFKVPFKVFGPRGGYRGTVSGYTSNDPLGVGGGIFPDMPCVHFKKGGWILLSDFLNNYDVVGGKILQKRRLHRATRKGMKCKCVCMGSSY